jgi:8-oxo-dGTP pyrophosphatase MutT (NUDIX family)
MNRRSHLQALLEDHTPADEREAGFKTEMTELLGAQGDCFSRNHFRPGHFTASAFVLSPDGEELLLIYHSKLTRWLQPGGHVDPEDQDVLQAAAREVEEETGLDGLDPIGAGLFDIDIHEIPARKDDPTHRHFDARILLQARHWDFKAGSDALDGKWVPLREVNAVESDESVMRAVSKLLSRGAQA